MKHLCIICLCLFGLLLSAGSAVAGSLPVIYLDMPDSLPALTREQWSGQVAVRILLPDGQVDYTSAEAAVKLHGHSTATKPKKPLTMKLPQKAPLLGMPAGKRWVLLANLMDHSLMRNALAFALARETLMEWTPRCRWVDLVVNGQPQGCYLLTEQIRVGSRRVDIDEEEGYLLEVDSYFDEPQRFRTRLRHLPVNVKNPDPASPEALAYIGQWMDTTEQLLYAPGATPAEWQGRIDLPTFADWWLLHELTQNAEPNGPRSCYFHKEKAGPLKAGPVWDFDLAFIDVYLDSGGDLRPLRLHPRGARLLTADSLYDARALWFDALLADSAFRALVVRRWAELEPRFRAVADRIRSWQRLLAPSAEADERLWQGSDPARFDASPSWAEAVEHLRLTLLGRIRSLGRLVRALGQQ